MASDDRLKTAVHSVEVPPYLAARIRNRIRGAEKPRRWAFLLAPAAAAAALCVGVAVAYQQGHLRFTRDSQESYIASVSSQIGTLMRVGLGDHIHCAVFRKYPKNPPKTEELVGTLGPEYSGLIPIVRSQVPENYHMMLAHQCRYHGRRFVHLSLMNDSHLLSLMVTRKSAGESFDGTGMLPALVQSGIPMYRADVQRFTITAFESRDFLIYFVSDLPREQSNEMMLSMAPAVQSFLKNLEL
jgi:hypothetical protein